MCLCNRALKGPFQNCGPWAVMGWRPRPYTNSTRGSSGGVHLRKRGMMALCRSRHRCLASRGFKCHQHTYLFPLVTFCIRICPKLRLLSTVFCAGGLKYPTARGYATALITQTPQFNPDAPERLLSALCPAQGQHVRVRSPAVHGQG